MSEKLFCEDCGNCGRKCDLQELVWSGEMHKVLCPSCLKTHDEAQDQKLRCRLILSIIEKNQKIRELEAEIQRLREERAADANPTYDRCSNCGTEHERRDLSFHGTTCRRQVMSKNVKTPSWKDLLNRRHQILMLETELAVLRERVKEVRAELRRPMKQEGEMSMSMHLVGFRPPDDQWRKMKAVWDACKAANIPNPKEVDDFFGGQPPDDRGISIEIPTTKWESEESQGFEISVNDIPKGATSLRFYCSW